MRWDEKPGEEEEEEDGRGEESGGAIVLDKTPHQSAEAGSTHIHEHHGEREDEELLCLILKKEGQMSGEDGWVLC